MLVGLKGIHSCALEEYRVGVGILVTSLVGEVFGGEAVFNN